MRYLPIAPFLALAIQAPATGQHFLEASRGPDGGWNAAAFDGQSDAQLCVTSLIVLAYLAGDSTLSEGRYREGVRAGVNWLRANQDAAGRFALRADPSWCLDHAIATFALAETDRLAPTAPLRPVLLAAVGALTLHLHKARPAVDPEVRAWACGVLRSLRRTDLVQVRPRADGLAAVLAALPAVEPTTPRERAARLLLDDGPVDSGRLPPGWPEDVMADPLLTFYLATVAFRTGGNCWRKVQPELKRLRRFQLGAGWKFAGSWEPEGEFGERHGRLGTTAVHVMSLQLYYRYSQLALTH